MGIGRRVLTELRRRPVKHIIFLTIFTLVFTALLIGLSMQATAAAAKQQVLSVIGPYFQLDERDDSEGDFIIDDSIRSEISALPGVTGVNQNEVEYALADGFETVKDYEGVTPDPDPALYEDSVDLTPNSVILDMNRQTALIDDFRLGDSVLTEGVYPDGETQGLLIEERLAEKNGLSLGDTLSFSLSSGAKATGTVVGIYRTSGTFTVTEDNFAGEAVFAWSPYNRIYASLDFAEALYGKDIDTMPLSVYVDSLSGMTQVGNSIKALELDWKHTYVLYNMTESDYELDKSAQQIETLTNYASSILLYTVLLCLILVSLVLNLFQQYYTKDAGLLIALGCGKRTVIAQYLASVSLVMAAAIILAGVLSAGLVNTVVGKLVQTAAINWATTSSFEDGMDHAVSVSVQGVQPGTVAAFLLWAVLLTLLSSAPLLWQILRYRPRTILSKNG